jgi:hypothetical protein
MKRRAMIITVRNSGGATLGRRRRMNPDKVATSEGRLDLIRNRSLSSACSVLICLALSGCSSGADRPAEVIDIETAVRSASIPSRLTAGETAFNANCAACHGDRALGTAQGPPLVHIFYEPNHHADIAFHMAVERGVRAHHWSFGDMPPIAGVDRTQVDAIVAYVRFLQQEGGIF